MVVPDDHPVLSVLRARLARGSTAGQHHDGHTVALAVQGGAVRGVYSAGMLAALEDLGLLAMVDRVYACSSGALNAAYALSGEGWYALSIYYDDLPTQRLIDFARILRGENLIDIDLIFDQILETHRPLNYAALLASGVELRIAITDVEDVRAVAVAGLDTKEELRAALKASCWLPLAVKGTTKFRGRSAIDGGVIVKHPARLALADEEVTHVLALSTHPRGVRKSVTKRAQFSARIALDRLAPGLADAYVLGIKEYDHDREWMERASSHPVHSPYLLELAPEADAPRIKAYETDGDRIFRGARSAYTTAYRVLSGTPETRVVARFVPAPPPLGTSSPSGTP